jgi:CDP-paratose 2-epimerase
LHGFLNYLVRVAMREGPYTVFGYKGKQVRDQIHAWDAVNAFWSFAQDPRPGEIYNLGGGKENAASLLECVDRIAEKTGKRPRLTMTPENRIGDHICYRSDLRKLRSHFPSWDLAYSLDRVTEESIGSVSDRQAA